MTNGDIAAIFGRISQILALMGENPFRVNAYDRAAMTMTSLPRSVAETYKEEGIEGLLEIPGIGKDLAAKIEELLKTGDLQYLHILEKEVPAGLLQIASIPGMGPKKTVFVWKNFKVKDMDDLEKLAKSGKLSVVKGWGEKSVENVLKGIAIRRLNQQRGTLPSVFLQAEELVTSLKKTGLCEKLEIGGSLRRRKETIGDIDILATSKKPEKVMEAFCAFPGIEDIIARGSTKSSVRLKTGINVDLRVVDPKVFGAALHYFTGSKEHNIHVRTIGIRKGVTISEYGVFKGTAENKGKLLASETEEDVFAAVGLPWIPPELRENRGEIEAAYDGKLPDLLEEKHIKGDLHMHSHFSDGAVSMIEMAKAAKKRGLEYIAFTDHGSPMGMVKGIKSGNIKDYLKLVEEARKAVPGIHILAGTEVDIMDDGSLYLPDEILEQLDWVVASVHGKFSMSKEESTKRMLKAVRHPLVDVIGHPTGRLLQERPGIVFDEQEVFTAAKESGTALEINTSVERLDLNDVLCRTAKDIGVKLTIGSDAHSPQGLQYRFGIDQAKRGWIEKKDVLNTLPWKEFVKHLRK